MRQEFPIEQCAESVSFTMFWTLDIPHMIRGALLIPRFYLFSLFADDTTEIQTKHIQYAQYQNPNLSWRLGRRQMKQFTGTE